jgi:hypothetical protein
LSIAQRTWIVAGVATVLACAWMVWLGSPVFPLDDAYIVQHAVEGLYAGHDTRFPDARPLTGSTSPLHVFLIASIAWLVSVEWAQMIVAGLAAVLYVAGAFHLSMRAGASLRWAAGVALLAVMAGHSVHQVFNGLETGLAMAAVIWALVWFFEPRPVSYWRYALLGVLPWIRPELAALSGLLALRAVWAEWQNDPRLPAIWMARMGLGLLLGVLPVAALLLVNGYPLIANTVSAKANFFAEGCRPVVEKMHTASWIVRDFILLFGLGSIGFGLLMVSRFRWIGLVFVVAFLAAYMARLPGALWHNYFRYLHVLLPLAIAGWALLPLVAGDRVRRAGAAVLTVSVGFAAVAFPASLQTYSRSLDVTRNELAGVAEWVAQNVPRDATILIHDAGYISRVGTQPLVDLVGLKTPTSSVVHAETTYATCSRDPRSIDRIARAGKATHMVLLPHWDELFSLSDGLRASGWTVTRLDVARTNALYHVYTIAPPEGEIERPVGAVAAR